MSVVLLFLIPFLHYSCSFASIIIDEALWFLLVLDLKKAYLLESKHKICLSGKLQKGNVPHFLIQQMEASIKSRIGVDPAQNK